MEGGYNLICVPRAAFPHRAGRAVDHAYLQWWFPAEFRTDNALTDYIKTEREKFIRANLPHIYATLLARAQWLFPYAEGRYPAHPKRLAYSTLFYVILTRYAQGRTFAAAHRLDGPDREQLLALRRGELSLEEARAIHRRWKEEAGRAEPFYKRTTDEMYLISVKDNLRMLLGL